MAESLEKVLVSVRIYLQKYPLPQSNKVNVGKGSVRANDAN